METILAICIGLGLSAACGFRVFVPLFGISLAAHAGHLTLASDFQWLGSHAALLALGIATVLEISGYYVPWLDHFLDTVSTPAAILAGTIVSASVMTDMSPFLRWSLAVIAGGGLAAAVQSTTVLTRAASTLTTAGLANPLVATLELGGSALFTLLAILAPFLAILAIILSVGMVTVLVASRRRKLSRPSTANINSAQII